MEYMLGVDIGTTSVKTVLYDLDGKVQGYSNDGYDLYQDTPQIWPRKIQKKSSPQ